MLHASGRHTGGNDGARTLKVREQAATYFLCCYAGLVAAARVAPCGFQRCDYGLREGTENPMQGDDWKNKWAK